MTVSQKGMMPIDDGDETTINIQNYRCNKIYRGEIEIRISQIFDLYSGNNTDT